MTLEEDINSSNEYYLQAGIAVIHKKPTPVQIVDVDYPKRSAAVIKEAYFQKPSTTDYNGVYRGKYIDFEAKETKQKTSFPLKNFHEHQIEHMRRVLKQDGLCFVLMRFAAFHEIYFLEASHLLRYWDEQRSGGRKSIKKEEIQRDGYPLSAGFRPRIDYLKIVDTIYFN
jgi:recombination protein U